MDRGGKSTGSDNNERWKCRNMNTKTWRRKKKTEKRIRIVTHNALLIFFIFLFAYIRIAKGCRFLCTKNLTLVERCSHANSHNEYFYQYQQIHLCDNNRAPGYFVIFQAEKWQNLSMLRRRSIGFLRIHICRQNGFSALVLASFATSVMLHTHTSAAAYPSIRPRALNTLGIVIIPFKVLCFLCCFLCLRLFLSLLCWFAFLCVNRHSLNGFLYSARRRSVFNHCKWYNKNKIKPFKILMSTGEMKVIENL